MNIKNLLLMLLVCSVGYLAAERTETIFRVPLSSSVRHARVHVITNNNHVITQNNTNTMSVQVAQQKTRLDWADYCGDILWRHKNKVAIGSALSVYGAIWMRLLWQASKMEQHNLWANWHEQDPLDALVKVDQQLLQRELLASIKLHYGLQNPTGPIDLYGYNLLFLKDVAQELEQLDHFLDVYTVLAWSRLGCLFPCQAAAQQQAQAHKERLLFLQNMIKQHCMQAV